MDLLIEDFTAWVKSKDGSNPLWQACHASNCPIASWLNETQSGKFLIGINLFGNLVVSCSLQDRYVEDIPEWIVDFVGYLDWVYKSRYPDIKVTPNQVLSLLRTMYDPRV